MLFSELYSAYYNTVAEILARAVKGTLEEKEIRRLIAEHAFSESALTVLPALKTGKWQFIKPDGSTPLRHAPSMPLTTLQKRWLKAILLDPRIALFGLNPDVLPDTVPLFTPEDYLIFDRYADGDPYADEGYIARFRLILEAVREHHPLQIRMINRHEKEITVFILPEYLEYSEKDDKFRLITSGCRYGRIINLARITFCEKTDKNVKPFPKSDTPAPCCLTLEIEEDRNTLERVMLHFAHYEKRTEKIAPHRYRLTLKYQKNDETELIIRVLSFGPLVRVVEPAHFAAQIKSRLEKQRNLLP